MMPTKRRKTILELIGTHNSISVMELSSILGVSDMTIRRDLRVLSNMGLLERVHGGALISRGRSFEPPYFVRELEFNQQKVSIGKRAAKLVNQGDSIAIDIGTTSLEFARVIKKIPNLSVITSSLRIASVLVECPNIRLILTGGMVRHQEHSLIGFIAERTYQDFYVDKAFIGLGGIHPKNGLTEYNLEDAQVKKPLISNAGQVIVLADSRKLGVTCLASVAPISMVDILVTDANASPEMLEQFRENKIEIIIAD
jgi:DeoR/GlpR family transcriptional regulator of sugar metabolism